MTEALKSLPLDTLHRELGGKMVPFAGYSMPVQYPAGVRAEHLWTRSRAGLFDVSHMGQAMLRSAVGGGHETIAAELEMLLPGCIARLAPGRIRYSLLMAEDGGVLDDLMVSRLPLSEAAEGSLFLVVNAAVKEKDFRYIADRLAGRAKLEPLDRCLLAIQGPEAAAVVSRYVPEASDLPFMGMGRFVMAGADVYLSRCGYTGEDGFEISVAPDQADALARELLSNDAVAPIGLGARDSLRLEAGLCLYGHDLTEQTSPIEANLGFAVSKRRRTEGIFLGAERVLSDLSGGTETLRVGIKPQGRAPAREGTIVRSEAGEEIGQVTSGGFGPSVGGPVAMGYINKPYTDEGTEVQLDIRGKLHPATIVALPFVEPRYYRGQPK